jgi:capsule polysaccharide export protein KpsC/LpsZ
MRDRTILLPGQTGTWLNIDFDQVRALLEKQGIRSESMEVDLMDLAASPPQKTDRPIDSEPQCPDYLRYFMSLVTTEHWQDIPSAERINFINRYVDSFQKQIDRIAIQIQGRIDAAVIVQGFEPTNALIRAAAIRQRIGTLALENTMLSDRLVWDSVSGITPNRNLAKNYYWRYSEFVEPSKVEAYIESLITNTAALKSLQHTTPFEDKSSENSTIESSGNAILKTISGRPYCLFLGQVYTDSSLVFGLGNWKNPLEPLLKTYRWSQRNGLDLVVKLHPKEDQGLAPGTLQPYDRMTWRKIQGSDLFQEFLQDRHVRVDYRNECNTYALIQQAHCVATINSQSGLEAAIRGKPVLVLGDAFYCGLGFTNDWSFPVLLESLGPDDMVSDVARARRFAYIFLELYCEGKTPEAVVSLIQNVMGSITPARSVYR